MGSRKSRVEVHSMFTLVSSKPIGPGKTHPLGPLDHIMGIHALHMVFYYASLGVAVPFESDRLRASLSDVLSRYPLVTGRLARPPAGNGNWEVRFNDAGVRVLQARVGATLPKWLGSADAAEERDLTAWEEMPADDLPVWSPFRLQVNEFQGGGVAIGLSCTHLLADPASAILLFKSWADYHRGEPIPQPTFFHPTASLDGHVPSAGPVAAHFHASVFKAQEALANMATATFRFSNPAMEQWLSRVHDECPEATPFHSLAALFWTRVATLKPPSPDDSSRRLSLCVDSKKFRNAKLPDEYFGNALRFSLLSLDAEAMKEMDLGRVAGLVFRHMSSLEEDGVDLEPTIRSLESDRWEDGKYAPPFHVYGHNLTCIDMEHFSPSIYEAAMFEKGEKPVHISCRIGNLGSEGLIMVMPSPEEGLGRTVTVTLLKEQMGKLCEDEAILSLQPTMLLK